MPAVPAALSVTTIAFIAFSHVWAGVGTVIRIHDGGVKTSRLREDAIWFRTCSFTNKVSRDYRGEVDIIAVYSPELDQVFLVPIEEAPARGGHLRLAPTRNGQSKGVRWARDYLLEGPPDLN